ELLRIDPAVPQLVPGPLYHNGPFTSSMLGLLVGQPLVVMERFEASLALDLIERERIGWTMVVPTMMSRMLRVIEEAAGRVDLSSLSVLWHMAAPCADWLKR